MTVPQPQPSIDPYNIKCLEVWGGSSSADHAASVPGLDISVTSRPVDGAESGGDLYLISSCSSGWISRILLADVAGHGSDVADLSSKLRKEMHKSLNTVDQSKLARRLNAAFEDISGGSKFATALLMTYFAPTGHLIFVNAGHPPPLLKRAGSSDWIQINQSTRGVLSNPTKELRPGIKNLPLGIISSTEYEQLAIKIEHDDIICAYTDAFIEAQHSNGSLLGVQGLTDVLSKLNINSKANISKGVLDELTNQGYSHADDDHTMLMLHHNGQGAPNMKLSTVSNLIKNSLGFGHTDTILYA
jgi:serine phosphatase RsbU (regulator of sigma subunit)